MKTKSAPRIIKKKSSVLKRVLMSIPQQAVIICLSLFLFHGFVSGTDLKNKVIVPINTKSMYQILLVVDTNQIIIEKDTLPKGIEVMKIKQAVRDFMKQKKIKSTNVQVEKILYDSLLINIEKQLNKLKTADSLKKVNALKESTASANDEKKANSNQMTIDTIVKNLNSDKGENIVHFISKGETINMYVCKIHPHGDFDILSREVKALVKYMKFSIENGIIKDLLVFCVVTDGEIKPYYSNTAKQNWKGKKLVFSNRHYIPLRNTFDIDQLNTRRVNFQVCKIAKDTIASIDLSDILLAIRTGTMKSGTYVSNDTTFTLASETKDVAIRKASIVDNLNLKVYTDVFGYDKNSINGIVQMEAKINFLLNTESTSKTSFYDDILKTRYTDSRKEWVWINRISPYIKWMKIENNNNYYPVDTTTQGDVMNLFKYATLDIGTEFNVITYRTDSKLFTANLAAGIWRTKIGLNKNDSSNTFVSTFYLNPTIDFKFYESDHLDFSLGIGVFGATKLGTVSADDMKSLKSKLTSYNFTSNHFWGQIQECVNFHPNGNWRKSIFLRANQYWNPRNSHYTFQIGYSTPISKVFN